MNTAPLPPNMTSCRFRSTMTLCGKNWKVRNWRPNVCWKNYVRSRAAMPLKSCVWKRNWKQYVPYCVLMSYRSTLWTAWMQNWPKKIRKSRINIRQQQHRSAHFQRKRKVWTKKFRLQHSWMLPILSSIRWTNGARLPEKWKTSKRSPSSLQS